MQLQITFLPWFIWTVLSLTITPEKTLMLPKIACAIRQTFKINSCLIFFPVQLTTRSVAPPEMPGLSIITWDEFIEDPSMFYKLFSLDKNEFIHFDSCIVTNFFHDSRMDPPVLGGPSGDGMSW